MTTIYLTDEDYRVIDGGDNGEIKRLVNELRGDLVGANRVACELMDENARIRRELALLQQSVKDAIKSSTQSERVCKMRAALKNGAPNEH
jgi:hypothetical protein